MKNNQTRTGTGEALRRLGQVAIDYTEACRDVYSARAALTKAQSDWMQRNGYAGLPERGTHGWEQMQKATAFEAQHLQRTQTRRNYAQTKMQQKAGQILGLSEKRPAEAELAPKKLALLGLQVQMADAKQQRALDKRRLSLAMAECGIPRTVRNQVCKGYFGQGDGAQVE